MKSDNGGIGSGIDGFGWGDVKLELGIGPFGARSRPFQHQSQVTSRTSSHQTGYLQHYSIFK